MVHTVFIVLGSALLVVSGLMLGYIELKQRINLKADLCRIFFPRTVPDFLLSDKNPCREVVPILIAVGLLIVGLFMVGLSI